MRFYTQQHQLYCGIDLHARTTSLCRLNRDGDILVHRHMPAGPDPFLTAIAPSREDLVVCKVFPLCSGMPSLCRPSMGAKPQTTRSMPRKSPCCCAAGCCPRPLSLPLRCCVLLPRGHLREGIGGKALWHLRHAERPCVSHVGLLRSGGPVPPQPSCGPTVSGPLREKTRQGQGVDCLGSYAGPGGL